MSAVLKIPIQFVILLIGVLVFVFFQFQTSPLLFNPAATRAAEGSPGYAVLQDEYEQVSSAIRELSRRVVTEGGTEVGGAYQKALERRAELRTQAVDMVRASTGDSSYSDVNYVFPTFVAKHLPIGLVGLMIAAIFAAAMSSISAELNSLATATVIDFYRRHFRKDASDRHYLAVSRAATGFWGLLACFVAIYATQLGSLIEVVNKFGSFFYGSILGVFLLAVATRWATPLGASLGLLIGMSSVAALSMTTDISFLWYNIVGAFAVFVTGLIVALVQGRLGGSS